MMKRVYRSDVGIWYGIIIYKGVTFIQRRAHLLLFYASPLTACLPFLVCALVSFARHAFCACCRPCLVSPVVFPVDHGSLGHSFMALPAVALEARPCRALAAGHSARKFVFAGSGLASGWLHAARDAGPLGAFCLLVLLPRALGLGVVVADVVAICSRNDIVDCR